MMLTVYGLKLSPVDILSILKSDAYTKKQGRLWVIRCLLP